MTGIKSFSERQWTMLSRHVSEFDWIAFGFWTIVGCVFVALAPQNAKGYAIAASVALFIAFVAYPWQKAKDRELTLHSEKLASYQKFIREITEHHTLLASSRYNEEDLGIETSHSRMVGASYELIFYAPKEVISTCQKYLQAVHQSYVLGELGSEKHAKTASEHPKGREAFIPSQRARKAAVLSIRKDIVDESKAELQQAIDAFFILTLDEEIQ